MRKLRELTTRWSLAELVEVVSKSLEGSNHSTIEPGETAPPVKPEGEKKFVKLHKTEKFTNPDRLGNPSFSGNVKKDTSRAGREPLPGFPPDTGEPYWPPVKESWGVDELGRFRRLDEQGTHALQKGENPWKVWKQTRGESGLSWGDFKSAQTDKKVVGNKSSRRLQPGQEIQTGVKAAEKPAESPKAPEFQKTEAPTPAKVQTPDTHGPTGAPQPSVSPKAPQWSPTAKPYEHTPVTPELKAKQIQSPINKEPMNRIPGTTAPPSAMDRVKAVTGRATPAVTTGSASAGTQATGQTGTTPSGPSASGSVNLRNATRAAGAVGQAFTPGGGGAAVGATIGKSVAPVVQPAAKAAGQVGQGVVPGGSLAGAGQRAGQWVRKKFFGGEETEQLMNNRATIISSLIRGLEPKLDEAAGIAKMIAPKVNPIIKRPKFDAHGNVVLTKDAKQNITQGKKSRKLTGQTYSPSKQKRFGESKEQLDEKNWFHKVGASTPNDEAREKVRRQADAAKRSGKTAASARRRAEISRKHPELSEGNTPADQGIRAAKRDDEERKKSTVLVSPKGYKGGGKVSRIPKSQYNPKKHSMAEQSDFELAGQPEPRKKPQVPVQQGAGNALRAKKTASLNQPLNPANQAKQASLQAGYEPEGNQLDEKNWIQNAIKKPGALTAAAHRAKQSVGEFAREHKHSSGKVGQRSRLALTLKGLNKEEAEQIDELKKSTLASYAKKSASEIATASSFGGAAKRHYKGLNRAIDRLGGTYDTGKPLKFKIPGDESNKTYSQQKKKIYHAEETEIDEGLRPKIKVSGDRSVDKNVQVGKKTYHVSGFKSTKTAEDEAKKGWEKTASKFGKWRAKTFGTKFVHEETELDEGGPTKKHFQMAADAIKAIPDENKRKEHAYHHAELYSKQNPRFNREKFYQAAGLKKHQYGPNEETELDEVITKSTPVGDVIHDFVHSDNKVFKGDSKKQRIKRALGAYYGKQRGE